MPGKHTDETLRQIFQSKLGEHQSAVPDMLWDKIASSLPATAAPAAATVAWKTIALWIAGAAAVAGIAIAVAWNSSQNDNNSSAPLNNHSSPELIDQTLQTPSTPSETEQPQSSASSTGSTQMRPIQELPSGLTFQLPDVNKVDAYPEASWVKTPAAESVRVNSQSLDAPASQTDLSEENETKVPAEKLNALFTAAQISSSEMTYFLFPQSTGNVKYLWQISDGLVSEEQSLYHTFATPGSYEISLTTTNTTTGEEAHYNTTIEVSEPASIKAPNVFTPNHDGSNDVFDISGMSVGLQEVEWLQITSPLGKVVFEGRDAWDGNDKNGEPCAEDNYYYSVRAKTTDGKLLTRKGIVRLERN